MTQISKRQFGLMGLMIMIAGAAFGFSLWVWRKQGMSNINKSQFILPDDSLEWALAASALLLGLSWGVVVTRLTISRPPWHRITCQPGFAACFAVIVASLYGWFISLPGSSLINSTMSVWETLPLSYSRCTSPAWICQAVMMTWIILAMGGRWRPEKSWLDRLGRVIGLFYVVIVLVFTFMSYNKYISWF